MLSHPEVKKKYFGSKNLKISPKLKSFKIEQQTKSTEKYLNSNTAISRISV